MAFTSVECISCAASRFPARRAQSQNAQQRKSSPDDQSQDDANARESKQRVAPGERGESQTQAQIPPADQFDVDGFATLGHVVTIVSVFPTGETLPSARGNVILNVSAPTSRTASAALLLAGLCLAQQGPLRFEIASVKPSAEGCPPSCGLIRSTVGSAGYHAEGATLRSLMTVAYGVTDRQISGSPRWMETDRFDIEAKAARPQTVDELHAMLAHLLEDRFHLQVRRETRQESVWNLAVAEGGPRMPLHDPNDKDYPPMAVQWLPDQDGSVCASVGSPNESMEYFALSLSRNMNATVIDRTGLPGRYDVKLRYAPDGSHPRRADGTPLPFSSDCADIFAAIPRQLGLKLATAKGPVEYLVVEHVEPLTQN